MKNSLLKMAMKSSISNVLETMFFLPVDFDDSVSLDEFWDLEKDNIIAAKLIFHGPLSGYCIFYVPEKLAASVTADFMGKERKEISGNQAKETVKEMTNIITGNILSSLDPKKVFNLSIPELIRIDEKRIDPSESKPGIFIGVDTLENHMAFQMVIDT